MELDGCTGMDSFSCKMEEDPRSVCLSGKTVFLCRVCESAWPVMSEKLARVPKVNATTKAIPVQHSSGFHPVENFETLIFFFCFLKRIIPPIILF